jgi:ABC-type transport system substrate-binding protein
MTERLRTTALAGAMLGLAGGTLGYTPDALAQGTLRIGMTASDVPLTTGQPDNGFEGYRFTGYQMYDALANWDLSTADKTPDIIPGLATEWHVDPADQKRWIFTLRQGVKFHDGSAFDADAVVWNFDKLMDDKSPQFDAKQVAQVKARIPSIESYKKIDDHTVEFRTRFVNALFAYELAYVFYSSPKQWEAVGRDWNSFASKPSGTGPFKVERLVPRERLELVANRDYWDKNRVPKLERLILMPIPDPATRTAALLAGRIDWIEAPAPDALDKLKQSGMTIVMNTYPHSWAYAPSFAEGSPWRDLRVRKAANLGVDRDGMIKLLGGTAEPSFGQVQPTHPWFGTPSFKIKYDPEEAKRLMREAGYGPDKPAKVKVAISTSGSGQMQPLQMNEFVQENLKEVFFDVQFEVMEWNALLAVGRVTADSPEMRSKGINAINISRSNPDPYSTLTRLFHTKFAPPVGQNWGLYSRPELDQTFEALFRAFDRPQQTELMARAHAALVDDAAYIWMVHDLNPRAMTPKVKGFVQAQSWFQDLTHVSVQ